MDEGFSEDFYDILFVFLFDFYIIVMLQWRKIKWAARQLKALNDRNEDFISFVSCAVTIHFTQDALKKWNSCTMIIQAHMSQAHAFQLSNSLEAMIEEDLKWEYIYSVEFVLRIIMCTPVLS